MNVADVPTTEPTSATAGDTWTWRHASGTYRRADGWVLTYRIAGPTTLPWDDGFVTEYADGWLIAILPAATEQLAAGEHTIFRIFTLDTERHTERAGFVNVRANPTELEAGDEVFWAIPALAAVRAAIAGRATTAQMQSIISGRQVMYYQPEQLMKLETWLAGKITRRRRQGRHFQFVTTFGANP